MSSASTVKAGGAYVELTTRDSKLRAGLASAETRLQRFGASVQTLQARLGRVGYGFARAGQRVGAASSAMMGVGTRMGAVAIAAGSGFVFAIKKAKDLGDQLDKMSQRTGASVEWLSAMRYVAEQNGSDIGKVESSIINMQKAIADASQGRGVGFRWFGEMGVQLRALEGMNTEQQFDTIAKAIGGVENAAKRTRLATAIFRDSSAMLPMIGVPEFDVKVDLDTDSAEKALKKLGLDAENLRVLSPEAQYGQVRDALTRIRDDQQRKSMGRSLIKRERTPSPMQVSRGEAKTLGVGISSNEVRRAVLLGDALTRLNFTMERLAVAVGVHLAPTLERVVNSFVGWLPKVGAFLDKNGGAVVSAAKLTAVMGAMALAFTAAGALLQPVALVISAIGVGFKVLAAGAGVAFKAVGMLVSLPGRIMGGFSSLFSILKGFGTWVGSLAAKMWLLAEDIVSFFSVTEGFTVRALAVGTPMMASLALAAPRLHRQGLDEVTGTWRFLVATVKGAISQVGDGIGWMADKMRDAFRGAADVVTGSWDVIKKAFTSGDLTVLFQALLITSQSVLLSLKKSAMEALSEFLTFWYAVIQYIAAAPKIISPVVTKSIRKPFVDLTSWLGYWVDMIWLRVKHASVNAAHGLLAGWRWILKGVTGGFLRMVAHMQRGWVRIRSLFDKGLDVDFEMHNIDDDLERQFDELSYLVGEEKETYAERRARQNKEIETAHRFHHTLYAQTSGKVEQDFRVATDAVENEVGKKIAAFLPFNDAIGAVAGKMHANDKKIEELRRELQRKEEEEAAKKKAEAPKKTSAESRLNTVHLKRVMGDFSVKNLDFNLYDSDQKKMVENQKKMVERQERQNELTRQTNNVLHHIATTTGLVLRFN